MLDLQNRLARLAKKNRIYYPISKHREIFDREKYNFLTSMIYKRLLSASRTSQDITKDLIEIKKIVVLQKFAPTTALHIEFVYNSTSYRLGVSDHYQDLYLNSNPPVKIKGWNTTSATLGTVVSIFEGL